MTHSTLTALAFCSQSGGQSSSKGLFSQSLSISFGLRQRWSTLAVSSSSQSRCGPKISVPSKKGPNVVSSVFGCPSVSSPSSNGSSGHLLLQPPLQISTSQVV